MQLIDSAYGVGMQLIDLQRALGQGFRVSGFEFVACLACPVGGQTASYLILALDLTPNCLLFNLGPKPYTETGGDRPGHF